ncbi:MAG: FG-GAP-like repeat-containing protein [Bacteroidota bacterium]
MNFKSVLIIISVLVYTQSFKAVAQTYGVGNTSVTADVGQMGNATATIPIYCPSGRLGIKPSVNVVFNSQANSGILGKGWNITGMSVISRSGNNWHLDNGVQETVKLNGTDKLTLDGQRLLLVQGPTNSFFTHNNVFRTEVDQFVKVTYKNVSGNEYFEVDTKDGGKVFYGQSNNSQHKPDGSSNVLAWYISKSYDRNGNYMEYFYSNTGGQILLTQIKYTGFDATINGTKTSSLAQENPFNKITFTYETTTYEGNQYVNGEKLVQNKRLQNIKTYADANLARTYSMEYTTDDINSYLAKVTEQNGNGEAMHPIDMTWTPDASSDKTRIKKIIDSELFPNKYYGDFDGDAKTDVLMVSGTLNPLNGELLNSPNFKIINYNGVEIKSGVISITGISSITVGDLNTDGTDDLLIQTAYNVHSGQDRTDNDICPDYNRYKLNRIMYHYYLWDTKLAAVVKTNLSNDNYIDRTDCHFPPPPVPTGGYCAVSVINPNYNNFFSSEEQLWQFLHVEPVLVDMDGDGRLDIVLKEMWAKREIKATTVCDDIERTEVNFNEGFIINLSIYPSSLNLMNSNFVDQKISLTGSGNRIVSFIPMDFNGNGKTDFMITYFNNTTSIIEYNNISQTLEHLYGNGSNSFPTYDYHKFLKTGDFNGDGKTDLVFYHMTNPNNTNSVNTWRIAYSNGIGFDEVDATDLGLSHNINPNGCRQQISKYGEPVVTKYGLILEVGDFNGDGKSDIIERHHHDNNSSNHTGNSIYIYYSKGFGFKEFLISGGHDNPLAVSGSSSSFQYYDLERTINADFDGDGKCDQLLYSGQDATGWANDIYNGSSATNVVAVLFESFKSRNNKLTEIKYSDKHKFTFQYSLYSDGYKKNYSILGKCLIVAAPIFVVSSMDNSVDGLVSKTYGYSYNDLMLNKHGRGLMGFGELSISETKTNGLTNANVPVTIHKYKQNLEFLYKLDLYSTTNYLVANGGFAGSSNEVSKTIYTNTNLKTTTLNNNINFFYTSNTVETNKLNGLRKTTCFEYDENGNLIHMLESFDKTNNTIGVYEYTNTSDFKYEQYNSWIPASLTISRNCQIRNNNTAPYYVQKEMKYFTNGNLNETEYFKNNLSYYYKEIINYDKYGNIVFTALDSANNNTTNVFRNKSFTYTDGRFLQKVKNALNQETVFVYEPMYGNKTSEAGANNLITSYEYDNWGKLVKTNYPNGNVEDIVFTWSPSNTINAYYFVTKTNSLGNMSWDYYDALGNKIMTKNKGFKGKVATKTWIYNADNLLIEESNWFDATSSTTIGNTKKLTIYSYDIYKRPETKRYSGALMATYIYDYGTTKTTVKDGKNRQKYTLLNATGLVETASDNAGSTISYKYGSHNKLIETTTNGTIISIDYNVQLNKISMNDPNTGTILYDYSAFGDLIGQKDAKNNMYYFKYDELGRLAQKWGGNDVYEYTFYSTVGHASLNQIQKEELKTSGTSKHKKEYTYNSLGSLQSVVETLPIDVYTTSYRYDAYQRIETITYPILEITHVYDNYNNLEAIWQEGTAIWTKNSEDVDGKMTSETYGNGFTTTYAFDSHRQLSGIYSENTTSSQTALYVNYDFELETGNLKNRQYDNNSIEEFEYDNLDRLVTIDETINGLNNIKTYNYGANGNILAIENGGQHTLKYESAKPHALTDHKFENTVTTVPSPSFDPHNYTYTAFDKIQHIEQNDIAVLDMEYGVDQQRIHMAVAEYGTVTVDNYYVTSANMEIIQGQTYSYLYAEGKAFALYKEGEQMFYLHHDYQGSLMAISTQDGYSVERRSYDAWGRPRDPITWSYNLGQAFGGAGYGKTMRGYTMHEHLEMFSLINMNGRLYDPIVGRMLSPDNYIQEPGNTQSYNRYSYCVNNPLKYTDPSGNSWVNWAYALAGAYGGGVAANGGELNPLHWSPTNPGTYFGILGGAAIGYMGANGTTFNINANISGVTLPLGRITVGIVNTALSLGFGSETFGGYLGSDFVLKHNKENSGNDLTMNDNYRTIVNPAKRSFFTLGDKGRVEIYQFEKYSDLGVYGLTIDLGFDNFEHEGKFNWVQTVCTNLPQDGKDFCDIDGFAQPYYNTPYMKSKVDDLATFFDEPKRPWSLVSDIAGGYIFWRAELSLINVDTRQRLVTFTYGFEVVNKVQTNYILRKTEPSDFHLKYIPKK